MPRRKSTKSTEAAKVVETVVSDVSSETVETSETLVESSAARVFDVTDNSTALDVITVDSDIVSIKFTGRDRVYEFKHTGDVSEFVSKLEDYVSDPESFSLGKYYNELVKDGILSQIARS